MRRSSSHIVRAVLPLLLTFSIVLAGFSLIIIRLKKIKYATINELNVGINRINEK